MRGLRGGGGTHRPQRGWEDDDDAGDLRANAHLLDEPLEGVAPPLARRLIQAVQEFQQREPGLAVLTAESEVKWVKLLADTTYVIERGATVPG